MKNMIILFVLFYISHGFALVIEAPNLSVVEKEIEQLDSDALVVFDVDCTLIVPSDCVLGPWGDDYFSSQMNSLLPHEWDETISKVLIQRKVKLVEHRVLVLLDLLKQRGIKTIALTAIRPGQLGSISSMIAWRVEQLNSLGIHFGWSFPSLDSIIFSQFMEKSHPVYKEGVIASARHPKGQVLTEFLKHIQWRPSKVIFIDDLMSFIDSVEFELEQEGIPHVSFYYTAASEQPCELNLELADYQMNHLFQHGIWLSDDEANDMLKVTD